MRRLDGQQDAEIDGAEVADAPRPPPSRAPALPGAAALRARGRAAGLALRRALAPAWVRDVLALFAATRAGFLLVTYVGYVLIQAPKYSTRSVGVPALLQSWDQWDALRYVAIAQRGYTDPALTAFFPLSPLLEHILAFPFGGGAAYAAGLVLSNAAFLGALLLLHALVAPRWGGETAHRAVVYLAIFPTALYTFAPYNESLFLLCSLGAFLALDRRRWVLAGALGALAVLTRLAGLLLLIPFVIAWWEDRAAARARGRSGSLGPAGAAWALLIPAGLGLYVAYCAARFGDPLAFSHAQAHWNRVAAWPWISLWWQLVGLARAAPASFYQAHDLLDLAATLGFLALCLAGWRRLPRAQSLYLAALLLLSLIAPGGVATHLNDPLTSNQRFVLEMFPGFITLALLTAGRPRWDRAILVVSPMLLGVLSLVFILGRWLV